MQNEVYSTLTTCLKKLNPTQHAPLLERTLSLMFGGADFKGISLVSLTEILFEMIDVCSDHRALLDIQNILTSVCWMLEVGR